MLPPLYCRLLCISLLTVTSTRAQIGGPARDQTQTATKTVLVDGIKLNYIEAGKGIPVIFVHGTVSDYRTWGAQIEPFSKGYRVISYSRRNHYPNEWLGDSSDFSVMQHARDLAAFIQALHLGKVHLVGHSFGGVVALAMAYYHPEMVSSLTLAEPPLMSLLQKTPGGDSLIDEFLTSTIAPASQEFRNGNEKKGVAVFIDGVMGRSDYFEKLNPHIRTIMMDNARELKGELSSPNAFPSFDCEDIKKLKMPVLLITGGQSPRLFSAIADQLEHCLPDSRRDSIRDATHGLEFENPAAFNKIVLDFISKH